MHQAVSAAQPVEACRADRADQVQGAGHHHRSAACERDSAGQASTGVGDDRPGRRPAGIGRQPGARSAAGLRRWACGIGHRGEDGARPRGARARRTAVTRFPRIAPNTTGTAPRRARRGHGPARARRPGCARRPGACPGPPAAARNSSRRPGQRAAAIPARSAASSAGPVGRAAPRPRAGRRRARARPRRWRPGGFRAGPPAGRAAVPPGVRRSTVTPSQSAGQHRRAPYGCRGPAAGAATPSARASVRDRREPTPGAPVTARSPGLMIAAFSPPMAASVRPEMPLVVVGHVGDRRHAEIGGVGGVEPAAQPHLDQGDVDRAPATGQEPGGGEHLELGRRTVRRGRAVRDREHALAPPTRSRRGSIVSPLIVIRSR